MDWKKVFDALGLSGTWWQWRLRRWQERWEEFRAGLGTRAANVGYEHKICHACGGLVDRDTMRCPRCGASLENWRKVQVRRAFGMIVPGGLTVSYLLMAVNLTVMLAFLLRFGGMNILSASGHDLARSGALLPDLVRAGDWWRLLTYAFLHGGFLHIGFNLSALSQVGPVTENEIGRSRFWVLYVLCALGGAAADCLWHAQFGTRPLIVGASGAIFGLIGFGLTYNYLYGGRQGRAYAGTYLQWALYGFAFGFLPGIDNVCHAGGFITGALLGILIERDLRHGDKFGPIWRGLATVLALATAAAFVMALRGAG